jgi:hypothetical protein
MRACLAVDELRVDAHPFAAPQNAPPERMADAEFAADFSCGRRQYAG